MEERAISAGDFDGVLDSSGKLITQMDPDKKPSGIGGSAHTDVTGGMCEKVEKMAGIARLGIPALITNGKRPGNVRDAVLGREATGTYIKCGSKS